MKTVCRTSLILSVLAFLLALPCAAQGPKEPNQPGAPAQQLHRKMVLTKERVDRIMARLAETNPEKAEELTQLREDDPEKFRTELRKIYHEEFPERMVERRGKPGKGGPQGPTGVMAPSPAVMPRMPGMPGIGRPARFQQHEKLLQWLRSNYPAEANELDKLQAENPELFGRRMQLCMKRYGRIMEAAESNPKFAEALKQDFELKQQEEQLVQQITAATDKAEKQKLTAQLERLISQRFDLIVKKKQIRYQELLDKLEKLKEEVKNREGELSKMQEKKQEHVKQRLQELVGKAEKVSWD